MNSWHNFVVSSDDDLECANGDCGAVVAEDAVRRLSIGCPVPGCTEATNDGGCVFVLGALGPECSYCGRPGSHREPTDDDDEPEDFL